MIAINLIQSMSRVITLCFKYAAVVVVGGGAIKPCFIVLNGTMVYVYVAFKGTTALEVFVVVVVGRFYKPFLVWSLLRCLKKLEKRSVCRDI